MANQKAELHNIPLKTTDVCLNKYNHDIKPYEGFRRNNSPFYGNVLSPFYKKTMRPIGDDGWISPSGLGYYIKDGKLAVSNGQNEAFLNQADSDTRYLKREQILESGNSTYYNIIAFFKGDYKICSSDTGKIALLDSDGNIVKDYSSENITIYQGEAIHFAESDNGFVFAVSDKIYFIQADTFNIYHLNVTLSSTIQSKYSCVYHDNNTWTVCRYFNKKCKMWNIDCTTGTFVSVDTVNVNVDSGSSFTLTGSEFDMFTARKKVAMWSNAFKISVDNKNRYFLYGDNLTAQYSSPNVVSFTVYENKSILSSDSSENTANTANISFISGTFDNNTANAIVGIKTIATQHIDAVTITIHKTQVINKPVGEELGPGEQFLSENSVIQIILKDIYETVTITPAYDITIPGIYYTTMTDAVNSRQFNNVSIKSDGSYINGLSEPMGDNLHALYHSGELQGLSISQDSGSIGTLLCGYTEIDSNYPIIHYDNILYYHDSLRWQKVTIYNDVTKATMNLMNERYILINTNKYFNCYDTQEGKWHHFASDWNDRTVYTAPNINDTSVNTLEGFISKCTLYGFVSSQNANYQATNDPFVSSSWAAEEQYISSASITSYLTRGYTPDQHDIDIYYDPISTKSTSPLYKYTMDLNVKYTNAKNVNSKALPDFTLIPSIFAQFVRGFINKGIIIDNNHSYIQKYSNGTNPIFAIDFVSQLEGITAAFIIQGQYFVVIRGSIYKYIDAVTPVEPIVSIGSMELVGYSPYMAIFWSYTNKTFYNFTGDNILNPLVQADEISEIKHSGFNPNTLSIYMVTDTSVLILAQDHLIKIEQTYKKCFPLINGLALSNDDEVALLSYNKLEGYNIMPIELETELYGLGNSVKSVNDCVYIRLWCDEPTAGQVELSSETLNETSFLSGKETKSITKDMWDKHSHTVFIRYQPKYQAATGFSFKIKSPFPIVSIQISAKPETVSNSNINI